MSRIEEIGNVTVRKEVLAPQTIINWNPDDDSGNVEFRCSRFRWENGVLVSREPAGTVSVPLAEVAARTFTIPDGQGGTVQLPALAVMAAIKVAFDMFWNEHVQAGG